MVYHQTLPHTYSNNWNQNQYNGPPEMNRWPQERYGNFTLPEESNFTPVSNSSNFGSVNNQVQKFLNFINKLYKLFPL
jgi:hypothetical protein